MFHHWIAFGVFALVALAGVILTFFGIGGTFLVLLGAVLYDVVSWSWTIPLVTLVILAGLAVLGEILEWLVTALGAKAGGVSRWGIIGTIAGSIIGGIILSPLMPIIGTFLGILLGAMAGAFLFELMHTKHAGRAWKAAKAALLGRALVSLAKLIIAIVQVVLVVRAVV
jgi:uncharacterized protein YqgC (DUF456 family)